MPSDFIELTFKGARKIVCTNPKEINFTVGDHAICNAENGVDLGIVSKMGRVASIKAPDGDLVEIQRKATEKDISSLQYNRDTEIEAFETCKANIKKHELIMKLVDVEYQFDRNKLTFYFTADKRVDFRALVKDLASVFRTRIELRQIGVRDEAKRKGGYGVCGCQLCCTSFICEFAPISTQYAKEQNLPMNPVKLSGVCGRLMCCLAFERDQYKACMKNYPVPGSVIKTSNGKAIVNKINIFSETINLYYPEDEDYKEMDIETYNKLKPVLLEKSEPEENPTVA